MDPTLQSETLAQDHTLHAVVVLIYLVVLLGVGALKALKIKSQADFSLAGRGLSTTVLVGTLLATWIGTGSIFGNAQEAYEVGAATLLLPFSSTLGIVILFFLAARIRKTGQFTIQDILEERFGPIARVLGTLALVSAYVIIVSYQYRAGATVVEYVWPEAWKPLGPDGAVDTGAMHTWAVVGVAVFVVAYTALAGMYSVAYTDVANGVLMSFGLLLALPLLLSQAGGVGEVAKTLGERADVFGTYGPWKLASVLLPTFFLLLGDANMYQRFFSARSEKDAKRATVGMFAGVLVLEWVIIAVALCGLALVLQGAVDTPPDSRRIVVHLAFAALPDWLGALMVATVVAIVVSTADSYLLSPATSLVRDVYQRFLVRGPIAAEEEEAYEARNVLLGRAVVFVLGAIALGLAFLSDEFFSVSLFAYTVYGASVTPALLAALFWRRATPAGGVGSMLTGLVVTLLWKAFVAEGQLAAAATERGWTTLADWGAWIDTNEIDAVIPAGFASIFVLVVLSLLTKPRTTKVRAA